MLIIKGNQTHRDDAKGWKPKLPAFSVSRMTWDDSRMTLLSTFNGARYRGLICKKSKQLARLGEVFQIKVKDVRETLFYIQIWNNFWNGDWELGEICAGSEVENSLSWWAVDAGEWVVVSRVVKDPSCPCALSHVSWMRRGPGGHRGRRDTGQIEGWVVDRFPCTTARRRDFL